jgi:hypothetical protein
LKNVPAQDKISILTSWETHSVKPIIIQILLNLDSTATLFDHLTHLEVVAINLHLNNMSILIISCYNHLRDRVSADLLLYTPKKNVAIVFSDFNARHTDFGDTLTNPNGRLLNFLLTSLPLCHLHNTDTTFLSYQGCSISDHVLETENLTSFLNPHHSIGTTVTSGHVPIFL